MRLFGIPPLRSLKIWLASQPAKSPMTIQRKIAMMSRPVFIDPPPFETRRSRGSHLRMTG